MKAWRWLLVLMLLVPGMRAGPAATERVRLSRPAVREALIGTVRAQLDAIRAEDWPRAYQLASKAFRSVVDLRGFRVLVTRTYPVVWKNTRAEFTPPRDNGLAAIVPARIYSGTDSMTYLWLLVKEGDAWRVGGVVPQTVERGA
ncbi:MAG: DUF4864 domain-containing protein [Verrucomicrobia bacterium]|nr:DUF4864 domain-containing protein [Verrucomicrobiota bacterium]